MYMPFAFAWNCQSTQSTYFWYLIDCWLTVFLLNGQLDQYSPFLLFTSTSIRIWKSEMHSKGHSNVKMTDWRLQSWQFMSEKCFFILWFTYQSPSSPWCLVVKACLNYLRGISNIILFLGEQHRDPGVRVWSKRGAPVLCQVVSWLV